MLRSRGWLMLLVAAIAGLIAVVTAARWMQQNRAQGTGIVVATTEIPLGARLSKETLKLVEWPTDSVPHGAFRADDRDRLVGRVVVTALQRGEPVLASRLAPEGAKGGLSAVVPQGKRAMTVRVNDVVGVAGFALPGTYVDVMVHTQIDAQRNGEKERPISKIVLEHILVMAVAQEADRDSTQPKVVNAVTLEVTPEQAELLDLARSVGTLSLVLRNQTESQDVQTQGVTKSELLGLTESAAPPAPAPSAPKAVKAVVVRKVVAPPAPVRPSAPAPQPRDCVEVIRGLSRVTECF